LIKSGIQLNPLAEVGFGTFVLGVGKNPPVLSIGARAAIGPYVVFLTSNYPDNSKLRSHNELKAAIQKRGRIILEDDVWIGARSVIFPGITLGKGCVVGAGSVVRSDVAPFQIVAGSPARCIREIKPFANN